MMDERRKYVRIEGSLWCQFKSPRAVFVSQIANISRGGVAVKGPTQAALVGDAVDLELAQSEGGKRYAIRGRVVRCIPSHEFSTYGVEFNPMPAGVDLEFDALLKHALETTSTGRRKDARLAVRFDVHCKSQEAFDGRLIDISRGGMGLHAGKAIPVGTQLTIQLHGVLPEEKADFPGTVAYCMKVSEGLWRLGIGFDSLSEDRQLVLKSLLARLIRTEE